jgi:chemotaxis protein MotB
MALTTRHQRRPSIDIWPGFVDALSQLLMVIVFILLVFTAAQFYLSEALSGRDQALKQLQQQVSELADMLSLERRSNSQLQGKIAGQLQQIQALQSNVAALQSERGQLQSKAEALAAAQQKSEQLRKDLEAQLASAQQQNAASQKQVAELGSRAGQAEQALTSEKQISKGALAQVEALNAQIAALREQLSRISAALDLANTKVKEQQGQITDLGRRLNMALVSKVEELARYRSEFFGRLRQILGNERGIRIVGDRFVFQSEVLFAPGSAELSDAAKSQLGQVITALKDIAAKIPPDINWILRVDGHTDHRPIHNADFSSNWELSTARAISVVRFALEKGISPDRLAATGFADTQPIDPANTPDAYRRNRRIELRLTEK